MPMPPKDISGQKFGKLTAVEICGKKGKANLWRCICDCGEETTATVGNLNSGSRRSCGCNKREKRGPRPDLSERNKGNAVHGKVGSRTYDSWRSMNYRCNNKDSKDYLHYGGRGISVCDRWKSFSNFLEDMGERPPNTSIDRIDVNGNYEPENCRWAAHKVQGNNRRVNRYIEYQGETKTVTEWAKEFGIESKTLLYRIKSGWDVETAMKTPSTIKRK